MAGRLGREWKGQNESQTWFSVRAEILRQCSMLFVAMSRPQLHFPPLSTLFPALVPRRLSSSRWPFTETRKWYSDTLSLQILRISVSLRRTITRRYIINILRELTRKKNYNNNYNNNYFILRQDFSDDRLLSLTVENTIYFLLFYFLLSSFFFTSVAAR